MAMKTSLLNFFGKETVVGEAHEVCIHIERVEPPQESLMRNTDDQSSSWFQEASHFAHHGCFIRHMFQHIQTENPIEAGIGKRELLGRAKRILAYSIEALCPCNTPWGVVYTHGLISLPSQLRCRVAD